MIKDIFPTKIYEAFYPEYNKQETVVKFNNYIAQVGTNRDNKYILDSDTTGDPNITDPSQATDVIMNMGTESLFEWIHLQIQSYCEQCDYANTDVKITSAWATSAPKGGYLPLHNHNPALIGGVFYIDASPEQGNLNLLNPMDMIVGRSFFKRWDNYPNKFFQVLAESGKLVLFPGYMYHEVDKNPTEKRRLAIGFSCS